MSFPQADALRLFIARCAQYNSGEASRLYE